MTKLYVTLKKIGNGHEIVKISKRKTAGTVAVEIPTNRLNIAGLLVADLLNEAYWIKLTNIQKKRYGEQSILRKCEVKPSLETVEDCKKAYKRIITTVDTLGNQTLKQTDALAAITRRYNYMKKNS